LDRECILPVFQFSILPTFHKLLITQLKHLAGAVLQKIHLSGFILAKGTDGVAAG
jgi:hypothetical protein